MYITRDSVYEIVKRLYPKLAYNSDIFKHNIGNKNLLSNKKLREFCDELNLDGEDSHIRRALARLLKNWEIGGEIGPKTRERQMNVSYQEESDSDKEN